MQHYIKIMAGTLLLLIPPFLQAQPQVESQAEALHTDWLDKTINPNENFYSYANGEWQKKNPIPPEHVSWGTFYLLEEKMQKLIRNLVTEMAKTPNPKPGSIEQKVGDFYASGMNESLINQVGVTPLASEFKRIESIKTVQDLQDVIAHLHMIGVDAVFGFTDMQDFKNSQKMIGAAMQGGLGLPDRDYYFKSDEKFKAIRKSYVDHVAKMFQLLGDSPTQSSSEAQKVMEIETNLAHSSLTQTEQRDPYTIYHFMNKEELQKATPNFSWPSYFKEIEQPQIESINLAMPAFFKNFNNMLQTVSIEDWKIYLRWQLIDAFASYLSEPYVSENFHMSSVINGALKIQPRWKRVINAENSALGFAIGKIYVEKYFPPSSKQEVQEILHNIRLALSQDLKTLTWMTQPTREAALKKLQHMEERVGYPDKWWDYTNLTIDRGPYVLNVIRTNLFLARRELNKIGKPVDRTEWEMTPQTVNAYYDPSMNNINLPAGILQPPFFDPKAPPAINYGAIGFVVGHEITHGFDDKGALFDEKGNLQNWWKPEDLKKFQAATNCILNQFSTYKVNGDIPVQGSLVVGEATADLGGLTLAYRAFKNSDAYKQAKTIEGFTPDQQFFLGAAHVWANNIRPEQARNLALTDPHPPMMYRVNGTLANMPEFQTAFNIPKGSPMANVKQCIIW